jgi:hypothetical protein
MLRRSAALVSAAFLLGVITFAAHSTEPQVASQVKPAPAATEPRAQAREPARVGRVETFESASAPLNASSIIETFPLPPGTPFHRVEIRADGVETGAVSTGEVLIYANTLGSIAASTGTSPVADDIATVSGAGCRIVRYEFPVVGKVNPAGIGGPYSVDFALYSNCPGAVGGNPPGGSVLISGSQGRVEFTDDAPRIVSFTLPGTGILLPSNNVWFGVRFTRPNAGVLVGGVASTGASCDQVDFPGFFCRATFGGFPDQPHASFNLQLLGDKTCTQSFVGYKNNMPSGPVINPGANTWLVDDIKLGVPECQMTAYEVVARGVGFYEFEMRRECEGNVLAGTPRQQVISQGNNPTRFRFEVNPAVPLPESFWFGTRVTSSTAGIVTAGLPACIGLTADSYGTPTSTECAIIRPGEEPLPPSVLGGVNLMITCAGQPPVGACCDMVFTDEDGESVCRDVPWMNCAWPPPGSSLQPPWIEGGACESDPTPFTFGCGKAACCRPDDACENLTEAECAAVEPLEAPRQWQRGRYCGDAGQICHPSVCQTAEGNCMVTHAEPGCGDRICCAEVCGRDAYCCQVEWDRVCVAAADGLCAGREHDECFSSTARFAALSVEADSVTAFSNAGATENTADKEFCCQAYAPGAIGLRTMWFKFVATDASARVTLCESDPAGDSMLQVFSAGDPTSEESACGSLTSIACIDDAEGCGNDRHGELCLDDLSPGETYYMMVASKPGVTTGLMQLEIRSPCFEPPFWNAADCNENLFEDGCDLGSGQAADCNANLVLDECDLIDGASFDCDNDGRPDDCSGLLKTLRPSPPSEHGAFGHSLDMNADWLVVGTSDFYLPPVQGDSLHFYSRTPAGWRELEPYPLLHAPAYVDMDGDWVVAGSDHDPTAYLFRLQKEQWTFAVSLRGPELPSPACPRYGFPVAVDGEFLALGKGFCQQYAVLPEQVFIFRLDGTEWIEEARLESPTAGVPTSFGASLSLHGGRILVGAPLDGNVGGAAHVFRRTGGLWQHEASFTAPDGFVGNFFGRSGALTDNFAFVGATVADGPNAPNTGAVYVFRRYGQSWSPHQKLTASDAQQDARFGWSVRATDNMLVVGATTVAGDGQGFPGAVYLFARHGSSWIEKTKLAPPAATPDSFGHGVAIDGSLVAVGAPATSWQEVNSTGAAYVFLAHPQDCNENETPDLCDVRGAHSLDCNGDDIPDDCTLADGTTPDCNHNGIPDDCDIAGAPDPCELNGENYNDDCDCDGIDNAKEADCDENYWPDECDIAMGAADCDGDGWLDACEQYGPADFDCDGNNVLDRCDIRDGTRPDCNLDGVPDGCDIADGSSPDCNGNNIPDECDILSGVLLDDDGDAIPNNCEPDCQPNGVKDDADLAGGSSTDCNADGRPDECGPAHTCTASILYAWHSQDDEAHFGEAVAIDGDWMLIGAPMSQHGGTWHSGLVYVFHRRPHGWVKETALFAPDATSDARFGATVALHGDVAVVGAIQANEPGKPYTGAAYVFRFDGHLWQFEDKLDAPAAHAGDEFGAALAVCDNLIAIGSNYGHHVYVFRFDGQSWVEDEHFAAPDFSGFGRGLALGEDLLFVGSPSEGAVHTYNAVGGTWASGGMLTIEAGDFLGFGIAMALDDDVFVVRTELGAAYVYRRSGETWLFEQALGVPLAQYAQRFAVDVDGQHIVIGLPNLGGEQCNECGAVLLYVYDGEDWHLRWTGRPQNDFADLHFGAGVALGDGRLLVGVPLEPFFGQPFPTCYECGAAYLYDWSGPDCDADGVTDACQIAEGEVFDCDANGVPDTCLCGVQNIPVVAAETIPSGCTADCQTNGAADYLDIAVGTSDDCNLDGVPDECGLSALGYSTLAGLDDNDPEAYQSMTLADVDGDGDRDLFVVQGWPGALYLNNGAHGFTLALVVVNTAGDAYGFNYDIDVGDLDADGDPDIVYAMAFPSEEGVAYVVLNQGLDVQRSPPRFNVEVRNIDPASPNARVHASKLADIDRDGDLDLLLAYGLFYQRTPGDLGVYVNDGQANFSHLSSSSVGLTPRSLALTDLDGDGDLDAVTVHQESDDLSILINRGSPGPGEWLGFEPEIRIAINLDAEAQTFDVAAADFDRDGDPDVVFSMAATGALGTMLNLGNGPSGWLGFASATRHPVGQWPLFLTTIDLNHDGWPDIAAAETVEKSIAMLGNLGRNGDGTWRGFSTPVRSPAGAGPVWIEPLDIDGDGGLELLVSNRGFFSGFFYQDLGDSSITMMEQKRLSRFEDDFSERDLDPKKWPINGGAEVAKFFIGGTLPNMLVLDHLDIIESRGINLSRDSDGELRFYLHRAPHPPEERLHVEFWANDAWQSLMNIPPGFDQGIHGEDILRLFRADLPAAAFHPRFRFRFRKEPAFSQEWLLDDVLLSVEPRDCNGNLVLDGCELADDPMSDANLNRSPDSCDLDLDEDTDTDLRDIAVLFVCFSGQAPADAVCAAVDFYANHRIDLADTAAFISGLTGPE